MDLSPSIKIDYALLIAFPEHNAFAMFKIHISTIELYKLANAHARRCEQVYHREITSRSSTVPHFLKDLIRVDFFNRL